MKARLVAGCVLTVLMSAGCESCVERCASDEDCPEGYWCEVEDEACREGARQTSSSSSTGTATSTSTSGPFSTSTTESGSGSTSSSALPQTSSSLAPSTAFTSSSQTSSSSASSAVTWSSSGVSSSTSQPVSSGASTHGTSSLGSSSGDLKSSSNATSSSSYGNSGPTSVVSSFSVSSSGGTSSTSGVLASSSNLLTSSTSSQTGSSSAMQCPSGGIGARTWMIGSTTNDIGLDVVTDSVGNRYLLVAILQNQTDASPSQWDTGVFKLGPNGAFSWGAPINIVGNHWGEGIALVPTLGVLTIGSTVGGLSEQPNNGGKDVLLSLIDNQGHQSTPILFGSDAEDEGLAIASDTDGNVFIGGFYGRNLGTHTGFDNGGAFIRKLTAWELNTEWEIQFDGLDVTAIAVDNGFVYCTGRTRKALYGQPLIGGVDIFIAKYNLAGVRQWIEITGGPYDDDAQAIAVTGDDLYVASTIGEGVAPDGTVLAYGNAALLKRRTVNGANVWKKLIDSTTHYTGEDVLALPGGDTIMLCSTTEINGEGPILARRDGAGNVLWSHKTTPVDATGRGLALVPEGVLLIGSTGESIDGIDYRGGASDVFTMIYSLDGCRL